MAKEAAAFIRETQESFPRDPHDESPTGMKQELRQGSVREKMVHRGLRASRNRLSAQVGLGNDSKTRTHTVLRLWVIPTGPQMWEEYYGPPDKDHSRQLSLNKPAGAGWEMKVRPHWHCTPTCLDPLRK